MEAMRHFAPAPWPASLQVSSALGTVLLAGISIASYRVIPALPGFTHYFGLGITLVLPVLFLLSLLSVVTGYAVSSTQLGIRHLLWVTRIPLHGLQRASLDPLVCKGSIRIIGNAGLFGYTGLYQNSRIGRYRLFATNLSHAVVLTLPGRTVVITPSSPQAFIEHIHHLFPGTGENTEHRGA